MKKLFMTMLMLAGMAGATSCLHDKFDGEPDTPAGKSDFKLRVSLQRMDAVAATRATVEPTAGEEDIRDLCLLFFDAASNASGHFRDAILLTAPEGDPFRMNSDIPVSFDGTSLTETSAYNVLIVANGGQGYFPSSVGDWTQGLSGLTEQQVYDNARATVTGAQGNSEDDDSHAIAPDKILMTGRAVYTPGQSAVTSTLTRAVSRYDVINEKNTEYTLISTSLWNAFPTVSVFGGGEVDYSTNIGRLERYYGVPSRSGADIVGGLYSFENKVVVPAPGDAVTTCLIVGISPKADTEYKDSQGQPQVWPAGDTKYYRVNIHPSGSAQTLKRNNVYKLTIRGVSGPGYDTEGQAYKGTENNLSYVINYWDLDDDGLVVSDGTNLLSIPTKTVRLAADGETRQLSIFTFGNGTLAVKSQNYNGSNQIGASLNGNTLNIVAKPLNGETERTGYVELSFAGLTATINVIQSHSGGKYLEVVTPSGAGLPAFLPSAWYPSDFITVKASGPWTATIHMDGFSFTSGVTKTTLGSAEVPNGQFRIYTNSANVQTTPREAFVLVKLDDDPDNYNAVLLLTQKSKGAINISPDKRTVVFKANRTLDTSQPGYSLAQVFNVYPTVDNNVIQGWAAELLRYSDAAADDTGRFEIYDPETNMPGIRTSANDTEGNRFGIRPKGQNFDTRECKVRLRVYLTDEPNVFTDFEIIQKAFDLTNTTVAPVSSKGGDSGIINLVTETGIKWKFVSVETYASPQPMALNYHEAVVYDSNGNLLTQSDVVARDLSEGFRVVFPKVYYPNRNKNIQADVTVAIVDAGSPDVTLTTYVVTVEQSALTARNVIAGSMYPSYGGIGPGGTYFTYFRNMLTNTSVFGNGKPAGLATVSLPASNITTGAINSDITYLNANVPELNYTTAQFERINTWRENEGVLIVSADMGISYGALFTDNASIFKTLGIKRNGTLAGGITTNREGRTVNNANAAGTRIGQFVTAKGVFDFTPGTMNQYYGDATSTAVDLTSVTGACKAVSLIGLNNDKVGLFIDPANRIVFVGEGQFVMESTVAYSSAGTANAKPLNEYDRFLANIVTYVVYTAAYGSSFSDLLVDGFRLPAPWDTELPAPWDDRWNQ